MTEKNRTELSMEDLEAVTGGFWDEIGEVSKNLWKKVKDVVYRLKDFG